MNEVKDPYVRRPQLFAITAIDGVGVKNGDWTDWICFSKSQKKKGHVLKRVTKARNRRNYTNQKTEKTE